MQTSRTFIAVSAVSAVASVFMLAANVSAQESTLTRAEVRAALADARAQGLLEHAGELATTDTVLQAREWANATQARVMTAQLALQQQQQQQVAAGGESGLSTYTEAGANGEPVLVVLVLRRDGSISEVRSVQLAALR